MTYDKLVATDLAALGADSRQHPRTLDASLRRLGLAREDVAPPTLGGLALVPMAHVFANRVARTAAGAMLLAWTVGLSIMLANPFTYRCNSVIGDDCDDAFEAHWLTDARAPHVLLWVVAWVGITYVLAAWLAGRRFEAAIDRHRHDPETAARSLLRRVDGWSIATGIAAVTCFTTMFCVMWFAVGELRWGHVFWGAESWKPQLADRLSDLAVAIPLVIAAAFMVGRARIAGSPSRARILESSIVIPLGVIVGLVTLYVGFVFDDGPYSNIPRSHHISSALRSALMFPGTVAVFLVMTGFTLWRRRREHARCGVTS